MSLGKYLAPQLLQLIQFTFTPTYTETPTITPSPTITQTSTNTPQPTATFTATPTAALVSMSDVSQKVISKVLDKDFMVEPEACRGDISCQSFISEDPYMLLTIYNNGRIVMIINDESNSMGIYVKPEGAQPPYRSVFDYYTEYFFDFFYNIVTCNRYDLIILMDLVTMYGEAELETNYAYIFSGELIPHGKMMIEMEPPK